MSAGPHVSVLLRIFWPESRKLQVFFTKFGTITIFIKHRFKAYSEISNIVQPQTGEAVIEKSYPSSFLGTDLKEYLDAHNIKKLVVVGMMSHMCVDTTVRACQNYGLEVIVIDDCCTTKALLYNGETMDADTVHKVFMASLNGMFAKVMPLADFMRI